MCKISNLTSIYLKKLYKATNSTYNTNNNAYRNISILWQGGTFIKRKNKRMVSFLFNLIKNNITSLFILTLIGMVLYNLIIGTDYPWQWYRVWDYIVVFEDGQWWAGDLLWGLEQTVYIVFWSIIGSVLVGTILAIARLSKGQIANSASYLYTILFRNTPVLVQIYLMYFLIAPMFSLDRFFVGILVLSLYEGAFVGEIIRGAFSSVSKHQREAGYSLSLRPIVIMTKIIFPQALRLMISPLTNVSINLLKHSSIVSVIAISDLTTAGRDIISETYLALEIWLIIASLYWIISFVFASIGKYIEKSIKWKF